VAGQERVLIPGDPERELYRARIKQGVPLLDAVVEDLRSVGKKFNLEL